jgi:hypothetical protein
MSIVVSCPSCLQRSRVVAEALGLLVACPQCRHTFTAAITKPDSFIPTIPTVANRNPSPEPNSANWDEEPPLVHSHTGGAPYAIALLPIGIPLLWLMISLIAQKSVFSFAAPVAIAVSICLLGFGLANVRKWSAAVRSRALLALVTLAYLTSGILYFVQPEWLENVRTVMTWGKKNWQDYEPADRTFRVAMPGPPRPADTPLANWKLATVRVADEKKPDDIFVVAHGLLPNELPPKAADDVWFDTVKTALLATANGTLVREQPASLKDVRARDYELQLPGDLTAKRVVRVIRSGGRLYYLGVDGPSVSMNALDVKQFWKSFKLSSAAK